jgi:hypothetical protein
MWAVLGNSSPSCGVSWDKPHVAVAGARRLVVVLVPCKGRCTCHGHYGCLPTQVPNEIHAAGDFEVLIEASWDVVD